MDGEINAGLGTVLTTLGLDGSESRPTLASNVSVLELFERKIVETGLCGAVKEKKGTDED